MYDERPLHYLAQPVDQQENGQQPPTPAGRLAMQNAPFLRARRAEKLPRDLRDDRQKNQPAEPVSC